MMHTQFNKILVIDDNTTNLQLLTDLLTAQGYTVYPASDGELAMKFVKSTLPDLILLDIKMPIIDGYEVCRQLKANERTATIPVIFLSALEDEHDKVKGFLAGGVDYITKPFQPEEMLARVRTHLRIRELTDGLEHEVGTRTEELMTSNKRLEVEIAERKQAEKALELNAERMQTLLQLNQMTSATQDEIFHFAFEAAVRLTQSKLGYLALMNEDETMMTMQLWSREAMAECKVPGMPRLYPVETTGLWGETVRQRRPIITNDYSAPNPWKKGTPDGHVKLIRHMNLPVIVDEKIVLVAGVGNKEEDYNEGDVQQLRLLMEGMWRLIERMRTEEEFRNYQNQLEDTVKQRTEELRVSRDVAEAANKAKSVFLANMSHELRTPLNAILGFSEMLGRDPEATTLQREKINNINRSGEHLLSMINDVLDLSKIEAGRIELEPEPFDLAALLRDIGLMFEVRAESAHLRFELDIEGQLTPYIKADPGKLRQILINLLANALKFTREGGFSLRARTLPITGNAELVTLQLEVADSGSGIAEEQLQRIFDPFVQAAHSPSGTKGTGLGLAITRSFVELMGGKIGVESKLGEGSLFRVELPVALVEAAEASVAMISQPSVIGLAEDRPEWRILIVEDNPDNRLLLTSQLMQVGFTVREAQNGQEGISLFEQWRPHLIWMDIRMPVMDGYEATIRIRQLPGGDEVKIVALTASAFKEQREKILEAGCDDVVHKPYKAHEIFDVLARQLGVKYLYEEKRKETAVESPPRLSRKMLLKLPRVLRKELHISALLLDDKRVIEVVNQIQEIDSDTAAALRHMTENFNFDKVLLLLGEDFDE
jgi:signal transduction histidine kinase/DNA-binding response OmpR family regulator